MSQTSDRVYKVITYALDIKERLDRAEELEIDVAAEKAILLNLIRGEELPAGLTDYMGDSEGVFLGARYALACWADELFIIHCRAGHPAVSKQWTSTKILEDEIFRRMEAAQKFWEQADILLGQHKGQRTRATPGPEAAEAFFLCAVLGFRGTYYEQSNKVGDYIKKLRPIATRAEPLAALEDRGIKRNSYPLEGREVLGRVVRMYGGLALVVVLAFVILWQVLSPF
jgi:type VI protein secretion system component VasF